jgi:hypothetical protein
MTDPVMHTYAHADSDRTDMRARADAVADMGAAADGADLDIRAHLGRCRSGDQQRERKNGNGKTLYHAGLVLRL